MGTDVDEAAGNRRWQQVLYVLVPFFFLLTCLGFLNFFPRITTAVPTPSPEPEDGLLADATAVSPTTAPNHLPTATITPVPTPTLIPTMTLSPEAAIDLLGPPDGSRFRQLDTISFYADWPAALVEPQQLALYVRFEDQPPILLGTLDEPNIGQRYRWQMNMGEMASTAVSLEWWVQLQTSSDVPPLLTSPTRQVSLLP